MKYLKLYITFLIIAYLLSGCRETKLIEKPNILFIFTDDQRYNTVNAVGDKNMITPNLDKLAVSGVTFTHSYNMGAWHGAVCVASRAMLNTGLSVWHAKGAEPNFSDLVENHQFWSQRMQDLGYDTYFSGKWHVKANAEEIFDFVRHVRPGMPNQTPAGYNRPKDSSDQSWLPWDTIHGGFWRGGKHWSEVLADDSEIFLKQAAESDNPFFMYLAFNAPHDPRQSPKEYIDMYPIENQILPVSFLPEYPYKDSMGCSAKLRDESLAPFPRTEYAIKVNQLEYFALISHTDTQIGRILKALEETEQKDDTYILYTADHGLSVGHHGLVGKQNLFDHSVRVPLILSGPGIPEDALISDQVYLQDVLPTALQLAGGESLSTIEFKSLLPLVFNTTKSESYQAIYGCYMNSQRSVRTDEFKLIVYPKVPVLLLFDMVNDPYEMNDLADNPDYKEVMLKMKKLLVAKQNDMDDPLNLKDILNI
ncbi:MAG: sulfatase-like hydrolase/transferase [Bacteroidales bacterium]|nr:sulfatase-like hydrolase/transferase [Bacteroidales bacterium]